MIVFADLAGPKPQSTRRDLDVGEASPPAAKASSPAFVRGSDVHAATDTPAEHGRTVTIAETSASGNEHPVRSHAVIIEAIRARGPSDKARAVDIATLRTMAPDSSLEASDLEGIPAATAAEIRLYHEVVSALRSRLMDGEAMDRDAADRLLNQSASRTGISIRIMKLCTRVRGYGDYDPIVSDRFTAASKPEFVLYIELDRFTIKAVNEADNEVSLTQELTLYTKAGTTVWNHPAVTIVDTSRNRRRDFFTTQVVRVSTSLATGHYVLNVTVKDRHGGSIDERKLPFEMVSRSSLASGMQ